MSLINSNIKAKFLKGTITLKEKIALHTYHLRIEGDGIKNLDYIPGQHMKVVVGVNRDAAQNDKLRSYSIWDYHWAKGIMDIAVCTFSEGLGAKWIENIEPGDEFYFFLKTTLTLDDSAENYFFIGDISTLGHFYKIRRSLPPGKKIYSFIYSSNENDFFPDLHKNKPFDFYIQPSDKNFPAPIEFLQEQITAAIGKLPHKNGQAAKSIAYIGGDARVCAAMPQFFMQKFGWEPEQIKMKSFWNPDKIREE